jgi:hypothetical protein
VETPTHRLCEHSGGYVGTVSWTVENICNL